MFHLPSTPHQFLRLTLWPALILILTHNKCSSIYNSQCAGKVHVCTFVPHHAIYGHVYQQRRGKGEVKERGERLDGRKRKYRKQFQSDAHNKLPKWPITLSRIAIPWLPGHDHTIDINANSSRLPIHLLSNSISEFRTQGLLSCVRHTQAVNCQFKVDFARLFPRCIRLVHIFASIVWGRTMLASG